VLVTANIGDSRVYVFSPISGTLTQITKDHSRVQELVDYGIINDQQAFDHIDRNKISKTVGRVSKPEDITLLSYTLPAQAVVFATTDGWIDNTPPAERERAVQVAYREARGDVQRMVTTLLQGASQRMSGSNSYSKPDDCAVSAVQRPIEEPAIEADILNLDQSIVQMNQEEAKIYFNQFSKDIIYLHKSNVTLSRKETEYRQPLEDKYHRMVRQSKTLRSALHNQYIQQLVANALVKER
jgi:serine/threonine protein phosphatase PrpC